MYYQYDTGDFGSVLRDIQGVVVAAGKHGAIVKVIIECCLLSPNQIIDSCILSVLAGAQFVKTCIVKTFFY